MERIRWNKFFRIKWFGDMLFVACGLFCFSIGRILPDLWEVSERELPFGFRIGVWPRLYASDYEQGWFKYWEVTWW